MKNIKHHTILVTSHDENSLSLIRNEIAVIFSLYMEAKNGHQLISPIVPSLINKFCSFFIAPDGSKEGYDASEDGNIIRKKILEFLNSLNDSDGEHIVKFVELCYGTENGEAMILNHN